jgi:hypothetical protein
MLKPMSLEVHQRPTSTDKDSQAAYADWENKSKEFDRITNAARELWKRRGE